MISLLLLKIRRFTKSFYYLRDSLLIDFSPFNRSPFIEKKRVSESIVLNRKKDVLKEKRIIMNNFTNFEDRKLMRQLI